MDFSKAIELANQVVEDNNEKEGRATNYKYPIVYPAAGHSIVFRPLFNPKSGLVVRLINRHEKVPCYRTYNVDCPICKIQKEVRNMTGQDPFGRKSSSKSRGICFAQYISSTNRIEIDRNGSKTAVNPGDIVLMMFPWSVYQNVNQTIQAVSQSPTGMDQAFSHANTGLYIQVTVSPDYKYTTTPVPYMSFDSRMSDDDFIKMLENDLDDLTTQILPNTITPEVDKAVKEYVDEIHRQFVSPRVVNNVYPQQAQVATFTNPTVSTSTTGTPPANPQVSTASSTASENKVESSMPKCYGSHQDNNPTCVCCPHEIVCIEASTDDMPF